MVLQPQPSYEDWFRLLRVRSPLLAQSQLIYFPPGTEMFQFPGLILCDYVFITECNDVSIKAGFPIRNPTDQRLFAPPRGLSQLSTSFFYDIRQGIHYALLLYLTTSLDPFKE